MSHSIQPKTAANVTIATPSYDARFGEAYLWSILKFIPYAQSQGINIGLNTLSGNSHIDRARNILVANFMRTDASHLLFIDSDIGFDPGDIVKMIQLDLDIVGAICPRKAISWERIRSAALEGVPAEELERYGTAVAAGAAISPEVAANGTVEMGRLGTGVMLIRRAVFEEIARKHPERNFVNEAATGPQHAHFDAEVSGGQFLSEDMAFCERARACGFKIYAYMPASQNITHCGLATYRGVPRTAPKDGKASYVQHLSDGQSL